MWENVFKGVGKRAPGSPSSSAAYACGCDNPVELASEP